VTIIPQAGDEIPARLRPRRAATGFDQLLATSGWSLAPVLPEAEDYGVTVARLADEVSSGRYHHDDAEYLAWYLRSAPSPTQP